MLTAFIERKTSLTIHKLQFILNILGRPVFEIEKFFQKKRKLVSFFLLLLVKTR